MKEWCGPEIVVDFLLRLGQLLKGKECFRNIDII